MDAGPSEFDIALELCRDEPRRIALAVIERERRALTLNDLTRAVAEERHGAPITDVPGDDVNRIHLSLHHRHVPKLSDADVVEYDRERGLVEPTDRFDRLGPHLSAIIEADPELEILDAD
ncbi:hypothetical protein [Halovivax sp.]|uniref:DUF7344 domain-containing protein n=1 Tax=Halovivax sp. TaxID=1935978 RepID=UPI0025BC4C13|nr:hypothetical protein [Halovivax sp.]